MRKNDLVKLDVDKCFTVEYGGKREFPLTNGLNDSEGKVDGFYKLSDSERRYLRESGRYDGMNSAGETHLIPSEGVYRLHRDRVYTVIKARAAAVRNYHRIGGLALVMCAETGRSVYVKRDLLKVA